MRSGQQQSVPARIGAVARATHEAAAPLVAPVGRIAARAGWTGLTLFAVAIVGSMVASIVTGPLGDRVLAQDGYGKRDRDGAGVIAAMFGVERSAPAVRRQLAASDLAPSDDAPPRHARQSGAVHWLPPRSRAMAARTTPRREIARETTDPPPAVQVSDAGPRVFGEHAVCVRLCDGYFFPMGDIGSQGDVDSRTSLCSGLCPGAPTRLFVTPGDSDDMSLATAVSTGEAYPGLAVAFAHTKEVGPTCACHPMEQTATISPLRDFTLRSGDSIMTPIGWRVFQGADHWPYRQGDFRSIRTASNLSPKLRSTLATIEDASLGHRVASRLPPLVVTPRLHMAASGAADSKQVDGTTLVRRVGGGLVGTP